MEALHRIGYDHPRIKILPCLHIGREAQRSRSYSDEERVTSAMMENYDASQLLCSSGRIVTDRGIYVCPILIDKTDARLGANLDEAARPYALGHHACHTCWMNGAICTNTSGIGLER